MTEKNLHANLANQAARYFQRLSAVEAILLGGSNTGGSVDQHSDIDLYVCTRQLIPLHEREAIVAHLGSRRADMNLTFWDLGDEWYDLETGIEVDVIYWDCTWIEDQLNRLLGQHQARLGYTTSFWYTVLHAQILFDRNGWFQELQEQCKQPYPEGLKRAIIAMNHPVLRNVIPSYYSQIKKAIARQDLVSINHRAAALLASYFDVVFALNEIPNPGEKKILPFALNNCSILPAGLPNLVDNMLRAAASGEQELLQRLDLLLDGLDELLATQGFDPANADKIDQGN